MTPEFIQKINWKLLKEQKRTVSAIIEWNRFPLLNENLEGIISLIDTIQDYAVDEMGIDENIVFDLDKEK